MVASSTKSTSPHNSSKLKFSRSEYNQLAAAPYCYSFETHTLGSSGAPHSKTWQTDLLAVALTYEFFSFAKERIARKEFTEKSGRPYLHYVLAGAPKLPAAINAALESIKLLLSKGCSLKNRSGFHTTWEYLLAAMFGQRLCFGAHTFKFYSRAILLFLEFGADPNQPVK